MTETQLEHAKLFVAIAAGIVGAISLIVAFLSYSASVERDRLERTFKLMTTYEKPVSAARSEFQALLRAMAKYPVVLQSESDRTAYYNSVLSNYRGPDTSRANGESAWNMIQPLGDYFERLLLCTGEKACSKEIYCAMVEPELKTFAKVTEEFRNTSIKQQKVFARSLDRANRIVRCG